MPHAGRNRSLVTNTNRYREGIISLSSVGVLRCYIDTYNTKTNTYDKYTYYTHMYVNTYNHRTMNVGLVGRNNVGNKSHYILKAKSLHEDLKKTFEKLERDLISCSEGWDQSSKSM